jgi:hypothetical protein
MWQRNVGKQLNLYGLRVWHGNCNHYKCRGRLSPQQVHWRKAMATIGSKFLAALALTALPAALLYGLSPAWADPVVSLGSASTFAVLAGTTVTNTDATTINGNVGVAPGAAITGFGPGIVNGTQYAGAGPAATAQGDLTTAYNTLVGLGGQSALGSCNGSATVETGTNLGGITLTPGVYCFASSALLSTGDATLTLNAGGDPNAEFIFQIGSTLTTATGAAVDLINNGGGPDDDPNIMWQIGSSATLGTGTQFLGDIVALTNISLGAGAGITCGAALANNGMVTLDNNTISLCQSGGANVPPNGNAVPAPASVALLGLGLFGLFGFAAIRRRDAV